MVKTMADYLPTATADYAIEEFDLAPQRVMPETGDKRQVIHEYDDGHETGIPLSDADYFDVSLEWAASRLVPSGVIMDLWHDPDKANGRIRSWYLVHPTDGHVYVVKFRGPITRQRRAGAVDWVEIPQLPLRVTGVKSSE